MAIVFIRTSSVFRQQVIPSATLTVFSIPQNNPSEKKFSPGYWLTSAMISARTRVPVLICAAPPLMVTFNHAIDEVVQRNPKARANPKALAQVDGYKGPLVSSLSGNLQRFGMERIAKAESLQEIIAEMSDPADSSVETR